MIIPLGPMTLEKWKERKGQMEHLNDRTWPYHGMSPHALKVRTSVLNKFWKYHISDKCGLGGDTSPYVRWFSAPTNLNRKFVNNGTKVAKFRDTVNSAVELTCNIAFDGTRVTIFLCCALDRDWNLDEEISVGRAMDD